MFNVQLCRQSLHKRLLKCLYIACCRKNTHDVPMETIQRMLERYERNVSVERVVGDTKKELPKTAIAADPESGDKK